MNQLKNRLDIKMATQQWVAAVMQQYGVSASEMEDALNGALLIIKDLVISELLNELQQAEQAPIQEEKENEDGGTQSDN